MNSQLDHERRFNGVLAALALVALLGILVGILALGGFFNGTVATNRPPADLARMTPDAISAAPGVRYQLSIETDEAGGAQGLNSSGTIDLRAHRFAGTADRGPGASMLFFGGPENGSVVVADGLFVQADGGPWEAVPVENGMPLLPFLDPAALSRAAAGAIEQAQIDLPDRRPAHPPAGDRRPHGTAVR